MLKFFRLWFAFLRLQFWQAMMGPVIQAAANRSEFQFDRLTGQDSNFETPWGKGPFWNQKTIPETTEANARASLKGTVDQARASGLHPLFALGGLSAGGFSGSPVARVGDQRQAPGVSAPHTGGDMNDVMKAESRARANNQNAQADYWRSEIARRRQAPGGDPTAGAFGPGTVVKPPGERAPGLKNRPTVSRPKESMPERVELVDEDGRRIMGLNPDAGLDEVGQAEYLRQKAIQAVSDLLMDRRKKVQAHAKRKARRVRRSDPNFWGGS